MATLHKLLLAYLVMLCPIAGISQPANAIDRLESYAEDLGSEGSLDYNTLLERLEFYLENPVNLNAGDFTEFVALGMLSELQLMAIDDHRARHGDFIAIEELQSVDGLDFSTLRMMFPFVSLKSNTRDFQQSLPSMFADGQNAVFLRWSRVIEKSRGFITSDSGPAFKGDQNKLYLKFKHHFENKLSLCITAEKDPGEEFFRDSNKHGFDFYSFHGFLRDYRSWLPQVAFGDYSVNLGQGLIMHSGFGVGKSAFTTGIKKGGFPLRPYTSVTENEFLRGMAITVKPIHNIALTAFYSTKMQDANIIEDTTDSGDNITRIIGFTSFQTSGLHRTTNEIIDKNAIRNEIMGGRLQYTRKRLKISLNGASQSLSNPFKRQVSLYNQFQFQGSALWNGSLDYSYRLRNVQLFGEMAVGSNLAIAAIHGLLLGLHRTADFVLLGRWLPRNYHPISGNTFGETSSGNNEIGLYAGFELRPTTHWKINAYADRWKHPWWRFNIDGPSKGHEEFIRATYFIKRKIEVYFQYKNEIKEKNKRNNIEKHDVLVPTGNNNSEYT